MSDGDERKEYATTLDDGTRVETWFDGEFWRARVDRAGRQFVRLDTVEQIRDRMPKHDVRRRANVMSDIIVLKRCSKSAELLGCFEQMCKE